MAVTIYDVARAAGVSHTAVSAVLRGRAQNLRIGAATAERILGVAASLGYERNDLALAVASGKTRTISIITREPAHEYIGQLIHGAMAVACERNYLLHLQSVSDADVVDLGEAFARCRAYRPQGVYFCAIDWMLAGKLPDPAKLKREGMTVVHSHCQGDIPGVAFESNDAQGMDLAVGHLHELGHRRIAFLGGLIGQRSSDIRRKGFRDAMTVRGLDVPRHYDVGDGWDWDPAAEAVRGLLALPKRPTAIVCANDCLAVVAVQIASALGLVVPRDVSVVGCSDEIVGRYFRPRLTTVVQPFKDIGRAAVSSIIDVAEGRCDLAGLADRSMDTTLAIRDSTTICP